MNIDLGYLHSALVLLREHDHLKIVVIGAGGTGSFAAHSVARIAYELSSRGRSVEMLIVDPDRVEEGNIPRSNFCSAEIGRFKSQTLADRLALAWGIEVSYSRSRFDHEEHIRQRAQVYRPLTLLVGCVDNHLARIAIHRALEASQRYRSSDAPNTWWIDGGNGRFSGQVLIGSNTNYPSIKECFAGKTICRALPAPSVFHPELLEEQEPARDRHPSLRVSCPDLVRLGEQSFNINQRVAIEISEMLSALLITGSLRRFATYFDLETGTSRSLYCTPEQIEEALVRNNGAKVRP